MPTTFASTPGRDKFQVLLAEYLKVNRRDNIELVTMKAKTATVEFYRATLDAAPTPQQIKQAVLALGWRVRRKKGGWPLKPGEKRGSKGPLNRMRASVIGRRTRHIGVAATGWLPAVTALGGSPARGKQTARVAKPRGTITIVRESETRFSILVENSTPGILNLEAKHHIIDAGFEKAVADIERYLQAKAAGRSGRTVGGK